MVTGFGAVCCCLSSLGIVPLAGAFPSVGVPSLFEATKDTVETPSFGDSPRRGKAPKSETGTIPSVGLAPMPNTSRKEHFTRRPIHGREPNLFTQHGSIASLFLGGAAFTLTDKKLLYVRFFSERLSVGYVPIEGLSQYF
jgi:hypothetical protein